MARIPRYSIEISIIDWVEPANEIEIQVLNERLVP